MKHLLKYLRFLCFFLVLCASRSFAAPLAMACHVSGKPQVSNGGAWAPLRVLQKLETGAKVKCAAGDEAVLVMLNNSARFKITAGKTGTVGAGGVDGGAPLGALSGSSARVAMQLGDAKAGAVMARGEALHRPLTTQFPGFLALGERDLTWDAVPGAALYTFGVFDGDGALLWSARGETNHASAPQDWTPVARRPYLWRLTPFGKSGKPLLQSYWGVVTFLDANDGAQLTADAKELEAQVKATPEDATPRALLTELYRSYGVFEKTLAQLEFLREKNQTGAQQDLADTYREIGSFAVALAGKEAMAD